MSSLMLFLRREDMFNHVALNKAFSESLITVANTVPVRAATASCNQSAALQFRKI